jgi:hypothetical protein
LSNNSCVFHRVQTPRSVISIDTSDTPAHR